jgi:purine-binding chemotaxis protein CheW
METPKSKIGLLTGDPTNALTSYLGALLREPAPAPIEAPAPLPTPVAPAPTALATTNTAPGTTAPATTLMQSLRGQDTFQGLLLDLDGMTVVIPLLQIDAINRRPQRLARLPDDPPWILGLHPTRDGNVQVIDTAVLTPTEGESRTPSPNATGAGGEGAGHEEEDPHRYLLLCGDKHYGFFCRRLGGVVKVKTSAVRWRSGGGNVPWLVGALQDPLCVLLDLDPFLAAITAGDPRPAASAVAQHG